MAHSSAAFVRALLRLLFPASGRHRASGAAPVPDAPDDATVRLPRVERREQVRRRRSLWLASVGIDNGPRWIHGVEVAR
jgi:hypothetical protein